MSAYDGFSAMEIAATFKPDYLLTDIMMPAMNGVELAITLTNMYPAMRILLFSGQAGIADILRREQANGVRIPVAG